MKSVVRKSSHTKRELLIEGYLLVLWRVFVGMGFFAAGYHGKQLLTQKANIPALLLISGAFLYLALQNGMVSLVSLRFSNPVLYTVTGLLGSYLLIQISMRLRENRVTDVMIYFGKNTSVILCTHIFVVEIVRLLDYKLFDNALYRFGIFEGFVFGGIVMAAMHLAIIICRRYFWYLFGYSRS